MEVPNIAVLVRILNCFFQVLIMVKVWCYHHATHLLPVNLCVLLAHSLYPLHWPWVTWIAPYCYTQGHNLKVEHWCLIIFYHVSKGYILSIFAYLLFAEAKFEVTNKQKQSSDLCSLLLLYPASGNSFFLFLETVRSYFTLQGETVKSYFRLQGNNLILFIFKWSKQTLMG